MKDKRPVNLDMTAMKFPVTAITSVLHRITGVLLFLALPFLILALQYSISGESNFYELTGFLSGTTMCIVSWVILVAAAYHVIAGLRHLLMDLSIIPISLCAGTLSSWFVLGLTGLFAIFAGVWLW